MRSQLRRSTQHHFFLKEKSGAGEGQNRYLLPDSRSTGNPFATWERKSMTLLIAIRPSSQGSRECPKFVLVTTYGKLDNKD